MNDDQDYEKRSQELTELEMEVTALRLNVETYRAHAEMWKREAQQANATIAKTIALVNKQHAMSIDLGVKAELIAILTGVSNV